jgi:alkylhydroperoxidase family enzyme
MRLPYVPNPPPTTTPEEASIVARVAARRHPRPLQALDLTLLHSPPVADGWNSFLGAVRTQTTLSDDVREIAICRVAVLNGAVYEWEHHAPLARKGGVGEEGMKVLGEDGVLGEAAGGGSKAPGGAEGALSEKQWAVVRYTDAMTRGVKVSDEVFAEVRRHFDDREVVEITATVGLEFFFFGCIFGVVLGSWRD